MIEKVIKFEDNFPKLCNQSSATLVYIGFSMVDEKHYGALIEYDTKKHNGEYYKLDRKKNYFVLFFVGDKGIMFSSLRKNTTENFRYYKLGEKYRIEVSND